MSHSDRPHSLGASLATPPGWTPLHPDAQAAIIEHVNEDHTYELLACARAFTEVQRPVSARLTQLFTEGFCLEVQSEQGIHIWPIEHPVPGLAHEAIRATVEAALARLGEASDKPRRLEMRVLGSRQLSPHMRRIVLMLAPGQDLPTWTPGYSCRFLLGTQPSGTSRPYTLRWADQASGTVEIDVFIHALEHSGAELSPGSRWALALRMGDPVTLLAGRPERFPDFARAPGGSLLCGDETAWPTIAALLEHWPATLEGPRVLLETGDLADQVYLHDLTLPPKTVVRWLQRGEAPGAALLAAVKVKEEATPGAVWGAMEVGGARRLRAYLRSDLGLNQIAFTVTGYWKAESPK